MMSVPRQVLQSWHLKRHKWILSSVAEVLSMKTLLAHQLIDKAFPALQKSTRAQRPSTHSSYTNTQGQELLTVTSRATTVCFPQVTRWLPTPRTCAQHKSGAWVQIFPPAILNWTNSSLCVNFLRFCFLGPNSQILHRRGLTWSLLHKHYWSRC